MPGLIRVTRESGIPLIGAIQFGIIDRGTNLLQVRSTTVCNMKCQFCSTAANDFDIHPYNFIVDRDYLVEWLKQVSEAKGNDLEIFIDSMGDPMTYPEFVELVRDIKNIKNVKKVSTVTNGTFLTREIVDELERAGLDRINVSFHSFDRELSKKLFGRAGYDVEKILDMLSHIAKETKIELIITPVWLQNVNDEDIVKIIELCKKLKCRIGIQKYEIYNYSRKMKGVKAVNWYKFNERLKELEEKTGMKLFMGRKDLDVERRERLKTDFMVGEKINAIVKAPGWIKNQKIAVARNRCITVNGCEKNIDDGVNVRIIENKNNIYIGEVC